MRGRVIAVLFLTLLFSTISAFPQCDYRLLYSGQYRASVFDVTIDNNDLWTASGYGVQLYDRSFDPPKLAASIGLPGVTRVVRALNGVAYAGGTNGISVVRKSGRTLQFVRTIATAPVNDLLLVPNALFAATATGIVEFNLVDATNPSQSGAVFATSNANVTSLALIGSTLYAADGDATVEAFSVAVPSSPQKSTTITSLARSSIVHAIGTRLYVSDGQRTEVFVTTGGAATSAGVFPYASTSIAEAGTTNVVFVAGNDRQIRAVDVNVPENFVELFNIELAPTAGTVNRVTSLQSVNGRLFVGGGDNGLLTYDTARFRPPFPLRAYGIGATTSIVALPNAVYAGRAGTGIQELTRSVTSGNLQLARQWSPNSEIVQDGKDGLLLTSSGSTLTFWTLTSTIPTMISKATFATAIQSAFLNGAVATVLLADGTLWSADMSAATPVPVRGTNVATSLSQLAAHGGEFAGASVNTDGTTTIYYWAGNPNLPATSTSVAGAVTALAVSDATAAVFTFRGISLVKLGIPPPSGTGEIVLPFSNTAVVKSLAIANGKVIALTEQNTVRIWDIATARLEKEIAIPGAVTALAAAQESRTAFVATSNGVAMIDYGSASSLPALEARSGANAYYKKAVASASRLYLFDGRIIEMFELGSNAAPRWIGSISAAGVLDLAASDTALFTVSNSGVITEYSTDGVALRSKPLDEGAGVVPTGIRAVAGAPWVSFSRGCTTTGCEKKTVVLDPDSLVRTALLNGGIVDVTANGSRAYALFDLPSEVRVYDTTDRLHPAMLASRATDVTAVSVAYSNGTVYLLGDKVYAYNESSLTRTGEQLSAQSPGANADLLIDNGCATISGRSPSAETYALPLWSAQSSLAIPGAIRTISLSDGRLLILTDYSIEVWSRNAAPKPAKRRGVQ